MRRPFRTLLPTLSLALAALAAPALAQPLTSAFTYQGELADNGQPASGVFDLEFRLYDAASAGTQLGPTLCSDNLAITDGRFTLPLDFGAHFNAQSRYVEVRVRPDTGLTCASASGYTTLSPRQQVTAAPVSAFSLVSATANSATTAANAANLNNQPASFYTDAANLTGTLSDARLSGNVPRLSSNSIFLGRPAFNGGAPGSLAPFSVDSNFLVTNLNADLLDGLDSAAFAAASHSHDAAHIASGVLADARLSGNVPLENAPNLFTAPNTFSGTASPLVSVNSAATTTGVTALEVQADGTSSTSYALRAQAHGNQGTAIRAEAMNNGTGLWGHADGYAAFGVRATSDNTGSAFSLFHYGLYAQTQGNGPSMAVYARNDGTSASSYGVYADVPSAPGGLAGYFRKGSAGAGFVEQNVTAKFEDNDHNYVLIAAPAASERALVFSNGTTQHHGGIYYTDADGLSLRTGGNLPRLNIDAAGNVGIGTTAPAARLHVSGQLHLQGTAQDISVQSGEALQLGHFDGTAFTERLRVAADGDVGIGTATPNAPLDVHVGGGQTLQFRRDANVVPGINVNTTGGNAGIMRLRNTLELWPSDDLTRASRLDLRNTANSTTIVLNGGTGAISAASKAFRIDHPLDPQNKELWHSCVESDEMKNIYDGVATTDAAGYATITLPAWFEALNGGFRYQLTIIDESDSLPEFVAARVVRKIANNQFTIRTTAPRVEVSWQVTGVRRDPYANKHRLPVEVDKPDADKGRFLHPDAHAAP